MQARLCGGRAAIRPPAYRHLYGPAPILVGLLMVLLSAGCRSGRVHYPADLTAPDPAMRIRAVRIAGDRRDQTVVPLLVDRLEDEDSAVRFYACQALRRITGEDHGYRYYQPSAQRARAVARWQRSLLERPHPTPGETPPDKASLPTSPNADLSQ